MPVRLQRKRVPGWRMPPGARYVGRPGPFGNPFHVSAAGGLGGRCVGPDGTEITVDGMLCLAPSPHDPPRQFLVWAFEGWIAVPAQAGLADRAIAALAGRDLVCWCGLAMPCHGDVWRAADAALFLHGRLYFHHHDGRRAAANAGAPSVLAAYGPGNAAQLEASRLNGTFVRWKRRTTATERTIK